MGDLKKELVDKFLQCSKGRKDKRITEEALDKLREFSATNGLPEEGIGKLVKVLTSNSLASASTVKLLHCLIPEKVVSNETLRTLLTWFFSEVGSGKLSRLLEKQFIDWIAGILYFELSDVSIVDSYFHSFLFLLKIPHLEVVVANVLALLLKPEDAKRWTVRKILEIRKKNGAKPHINSLLSILKSFKPDVVPENVPMVRTNSRNSSFHECFGRANERKLQSTEYNPVPHIEISWNQFRNSDSKGAQLPRLIPTAEEINFESAAKYNGKNLSIMDFKTMASLGTNCLRIEIPTQTLSLLANVAGFHVLAFSDLTTKSRFCYKLRHTLFRVFIMEIEPYPEKEKINFLESLIGLQEYMQEGVPVLTEFLLYYLLVWDGYEFRNQILRLIQWIVVQSQNDWEDCLFRPLRQIFRSSSQHCKCLIVQTMGSFLRNVIASFGRNQGLFFDETTSNSATVIGDIVNFTSELITEGIIWNNEAERREIITAGLDFYEVCSVIEYSRDFPVVLTMPPALVYGCLFSGSKVCIYRFCSLIVRFWHNTIANVLKVCVDEKLNNEVQKTHIYLLDYYRALWNNIEFEPTKDSFLFRDKAFTEICWQFRNDFQIDVKNMFAIDNNYIFRDSIGNHSSQDCIRKVVEEYSAVAELKQLCEDEIL